MMNQTRNRTPCNPDRATKGNGGSRRPEPDCPLSTMCDRGTGQVGSFPAEEQNLFRGQPLYSAGEAFRGLYVLRAGAFKNLAIVPGQEDQVVDFRMPGDVLGMAAMGNGHYAFTAVALEPSVVCRIDVDSGEGECLHPDLLATMSRQLQRIQWASVLLRSQNADQRVIHFLLQLSRQLQPSMRQRRLDMRLPMSRKDIANYLGIAVETVSRVLHRLQEERLVSASGRHLSLLDRAVLSQRLAGTEPVVYS